MKPYFLADQVRTIELIRILRHLNYKQDPTDRKKWKTPKGAISITGQKFMNWHSGTGGGGAIDLVIHLLDFPFSQAVVWLSDTFSIQPSLSAVSNTFILDNSNNSFDYTFKLPLQDPSKSDLIRRYLTLTRKLPVSSLQNLLNNGAVYSDAKSNVIFVMKDLNGIIKGAEIRGVGSFPFKGLAKGSCKRTAYFSCGQQKSKLLALCESAIDAISLSVFFPHMLAVSTAGTNDSPTWLEAYIEQNWQIFCAFDADSAGDARARALLEKFRNIGRIRPPRKDWNLCL